MEHRHYAARPSANRPAAIADRWTNLSAASRLAIADVRAIDDAPAYERNIENYIGTARVPIGLAGPVLVHGGAARGSYSVPLATTEAALVASYHRGMRLISAAGGCNAAVLDERIERTPAFVVHDLRAACALAVWIRETQPALAAAAERTSRFALNLAIEPIVEGNHVYVACSFRTGDAAGQNMVTIASAAICTFITTHAPVTIVRHAIEANLSGDKKATARAFASTRGKRVSADITIPRATLVRRLHAEPEHMAQFWTLAAVGASMSGALGIQGHFANGLAALSIATGQDVACVAESATGITRFEVDAGGDLYACVTLPNLITGTVGGGTSLPTQRAALDLIGGGRALSANALAEIAAALLLGGELSISAAICSGEFATAHRLFTRGVK